MREVTAEASWRALLAWHLVLTLCVLLGGVLLHSMNVLITATLLPSIVCGVGRRQSDELADNSLRRLLNHRGKRH